MDDVEDQVPKSETSSSKPLRFKADGTPDMRGRSEGSRKARYTTDDCRPRPGRTKGSQNRKSQLLAIRDMPVKVKRPDGTTMKVSTREALYLTVRDKALKGDLKAAEMLERRFEAYDDIEVDPDRTKPLLEEDQRILSFARERGMIPPGGGPAAFLTLPLTPPALPAPTVTEAS